MNRRRRQRGTILIVTILLVFAMAGMVVVLCRSMRVEAMAAANLTASVQAEAVERGAEQYVLGVLDEDASDLDTLTEDQFAAVQVGNGYFWLLRPQYDDPSLPAFGLVDEGSKLNINTATYDQLMLLPGMTDDIAGSIVDWRDEDSNPTSGGAESDYYLSLPNPYYAKNAPFETVEELLMVRGMTRDYLYGTDTGIPLGTENQTISSGTTSTDLELARGLYNLLTIYSAEPNTGEGGTPLQNVTSARRRTQLQRLLQQKLDSSRASQVIAKIGRIDLRDQFDLYVTGGMTPQDYEAVEDSITSVSGSTVRGRINVNTAPREVLLTLPGLDSGDVDHLIAARDSRSKPTTLSWFADTLKKKAIGLGPLVTGRSLQYSADILAVSGNGRSYKRVRIVVDTRQSPPQIIYRRDITDRGWPMDKQILTALRTGQFASQNNFGAGSMTTGTGSIR